MSTKEHEEFKKEFSLRLENAFLHFVSQVRSTMTTPKEIRDWNSIPIGVLKETFIAGGYKGLRIHVDMIKEGK